MTEPIVEPAVEPVANDPVVAAPIVADPAASATSSFYDSLSEENKAHASAEKFKEGDPNKFFKSYTEMESFRGKQGIIPPNLEDEADVARYKVEMNIPASADAYELDEIPQWAQDQNYNQDIIKEIAERRGLTNEQAKGVEQDYLEDAQRTNAQYAESIKEANGKAEQENRSEWGEKFEENMTYADKVVDKFAGEDSEFAQKMKDMIKSDAKFARMMAKNGSEFAEHRIGDFEVTNYSMTSDAAEMEMNEILGADKNNHPYWSNKDPVAHEAAQARMDVLEKNIRPKR
jgi:hypothetical protein